VSDVDAILKLPALSVLESQMAREIKSLRKQNEIYLIEMCRLIAQRCCKCGALRQIHKDHARSCQD